MEQIGVRSLGVAGITTVFTGMVLALQTALSLPSLGIKYYIGAVVSKSLVRELGPVLTALIVGGRIGSGMTAEIGTMQVTEQIDALRSMAADPVKKLVVPKLVASLIMLPALTILGDALGILGGLVVATTSLGLPAGPGRFECGDHAPPGARDRREGRPRRGCRGGRPAGTAVAAEPVQRASGRMRSKRKAWARLGRSDGVRNDEEPAGHRGRQADARLPDLHDPGIARLADPEAAAPGHAERFQQSEVVIPELRRVELSLRTRGKLGELDRGETRQGVRRGEKRAHGLILKRLSNPELAPERSGAVPAGRPPRPASVRRHCRGR